MMESVKKPFSKPHTRIPKVYFIGIWDNEYLGYTEDIHTMDIQATGGRHRVTIVDQMGNSISKGFEILQ